MKAALLRGPGEAPHCEEIPAPTPQEGEAGVRVLAASIKNIDRMVADGSNYSSKGRFPVVVGVDGVGLLDDGSRVYCGGARPPYGMIAERSVVSKTWCIPLPDGIDDLTAAALPNPALSSYLPLVYRGKLQPGETVLVVGATGVAGQLAVQIARQLGAAHVVAAGRNPAVLQRLSALGADITIALDRPDDEVAEAFQQAHAQYPFDVILDYVWGHPVEVLLNALTGSDVEVQGQPQRMRFMQIGEMAGSTVNLTGAALRSSALEMYGSGGGSIASSAIFEAFPKVLGMAAEGKLHMEIERVPLTDVESAWRRGDTDGRRIVIVP
jgi:NADPH:quinone reductase-like Zn-dependent oxidoreductase